MKTLSDLTTKLYNHPLAVSNAILKIDGNIIRIHRSMKDIVLAKNKRDIQKIIIKINALEKTIIDDFKIVSNFSIIDELLNNYLLMIHTGIVKITITEWKDCPITELMEHYSYYKYMSKSNNKD